MKEIPLTNTNITALVSDVDYDRVMKYKWMFKKDTGYVVHNNYYDGKTHIESLHRFILNASRGDIVDHKDRNKLNCQRSNLRLRVSHSNNMQNRDKFCGVYTSDYKGVCKLSSGIYIAYIYVNKKRIDLYRGDSEIQAAIYYNLGAKKYFGEFAVLNDVDESLLIPIIKYKGIHFDKNRNKWVACIKNKRIGRFSSQREAFEARVNEEIKLGFKSIQIWKGEMI